MSQYAMGQFIETEKLNGVPLSEVSRFCQLPKCSAARAGQTCRRNAQNFDPRNISQSPLQQAFLGQIDSVFWIFDRSQRIPCVFLENDRFPALADEFLGAVMNSPSFFDFESSQPLDPNKLLNAGNAAPLAALCTEHGNKHA